MGRTRKQYKCMWCGSPTGSKTCGACATKLRLIRKILKLVKEGDFVG